MLCDGPISPLVYGLYRPVFLWAILPSVVMGGVLDHSAMLCDGPTRLLVYGLYRPVFYGLFCPVLLCACSLLCDGPTRLSGYGLYRPEFLWAICPLFTQASWHTYVRPVNPVFKG